MAVKKRQLAMDWIQVWVFRGTSDAECLRAVADLLDSQDGSLWTLVPYDDPSDPESPVGITVTIER